MTSNASATISNDPLQVEAQKRYKKTENKLKLVETVSQLVFLSISVSQIFLWNVGAHSEYCS